MAASLRMTWLLKVEWESTYLIILMILTSFLLNLIKKTSSLSFFVTIKVVFFPDKSTWISWFPGTSSIFCTIKSSRGSGSLMVA